MHQQQRQKYFSFIYTHPAYSKSIKPDLQKLANKIYTSAQIIQKLKQFNVYAYTHRDFSQKKIQSSSFDCLYSMYKNQIPQVFSQMSQLILQYETKAPQIPILYAQKAQSHTFNKKQILLLMSMMSMSLIPNQQCRFKYRFPGIFEFKYIFTEEKHKTITIIEYLRKQFQNLVKLGSQKYQKQKLTLSRYVEELSLNKLVQKLHKMPLIRPSIKSDNVSIQQFYGQVKIDFANKFIGGGALRSGCVQQQLMFANHPQMYTSVLFCEMMKQNQAIQFIGYKKYFKNHGYGHTAGFDGQQQIQYQYDQFNRVKQYIVGIDALHYPNKKHQSQFTIQKINRQLLKAYIGFAYPQNKASKIVTGNWGCGAFNGDIKLKFVIQWLACSMAGKTMMYTPFGFGDKLKQIIQVLKLIQKNMSVGELYKAILQSEKQLRQERDIIKVLTPKVQKYKPEESKQKTQQ